MKKRVISLVIASFLALSQFPSFAESVNTADTATEQVSRKVLFADDFSKGSDSWQVSSGRGFQVSDGKLTLNNTRDVGVVSEIVNKSMSVDNDEITFDMNIKDGSYAGIMFRIQDDQTAYKLRFYAGSGKVKLLKKVKGGSHVAVAAADADITYSKDHRVNITLVNNQITVDIDGKTVIDHKDDSISDGKIGFEGCNVNAYFDNLEIFRYGNVNYEIKTAADNTKETIVIYAAPTGKAAEADGTREHPYIGLDDAKRAAKKAKRMGAPIDVVLLGGEYQMEHTINFDVGDSGTKKAPIRYVAAEGEKVVFTGATRLDTSKFRPVDKKIGEKLDESVRDKVVQINLKEQGIPEKIVNFTANHTNIGERVKAPFVTLNGNEQSIARWPNSGYNTITDCEPGGTPRENPTQAGTIYYTGNRPSRWTEATDMYLEGYLGFFFHGEWAKVKDIDTENNAINMQTHTQYGIKKGSLWAAVNLLEEIDVPGEWYMDAKTMTMYYYPPYELTKEDRFEIATFDSNFISFNGAKYVTIEGVGLTTNADDPQVRSFNTKGGNGIYISGSSSDITIKNCTLSHIGMHGIYIETKNVTIDGCVIYNTGWDGIYCDNCGNRNTLTPSNVVIKNCDISNPCRNTGNNAYGGIILSKNTVDVTIKNNLIHNCENNGIRYGGNGHQIFNNEFYDVVTQTVDAGAIYSGRSWAEYGTVIKHNFFHDIGPDYSHNDYLSLATFWDDYQSGGEFSNNIAVMNNYRRSAGIQVGAGVDNIVKGNTFVAGEIDFQGDSRDARDNRDWITYIQSTLQLATVPYNSAEWVAKYPQMSTLLDRVRANGYKPKLENLIADNFTGDCIQTKLTTAMQEDADIRNNIKAGKDYSVFVDPENLDYRVTKEAKEKYDIPDGVLDEDFDIDSIGIQGDYLPNYEKLKIRSTYPEDKATNIETKTAFLAWTKASLADDYRYVVSTDPEFNNILIDETTHYNSASLEGLENNKTYYWKVYSLNDSRKYRKSVECVNGVRSFTTAEFDTLDKSVLNDRIQKAYAMMDKVNEGNEAGQSAVGTKAEIKKQIDEAEKVANLTQGVQAQVDIAAYTLNNFLKSIEAFTNVGYTTLNLKANSPWVVNNSMSKITSSDGAIRLDVDGDTTELSLNETLSNYNIMCFKTKIDSLDGTWIAYGLRAAEIAQALYAQDAYYILVKSDIFELQKHGKIYQTAPNNGKMKAGEWYDVEFGAITTQNGINMVFKLNGETIFDYLDKTEPNYKPGMFAVHAPRAGNGIEIKQADNIPTGVYEMSEEIKKQVNHKDEDGDTLDINSDEYTEIGEWSTNYSKTGENGSRVRMTSLKDAYATWSMSSGANGNGKLYRVSYYHVPQPDGDKNVAVHVFGYGGDYETTIDLSQGEEGYVELGTFKFVAADYIGRLAVRFTASDGGVLNLSNIKYELVDDSVYPNMLK